jgi:hypothetical protein
MTFLRTWRFLLFLTVLLALTARSAQASQPTKDADILGTWTLTKVLDSADVASMTDEQAAALIGKAMVVRRDSLTFNGEPYGAPVLTRRREKAAKFLREGYHARVGNLGLPDTITVIDLNSTEAFLKSKGKIVVFWEGYFYDAVKRTSAKR